MCKLIAKESKWTREHEKEKVTGTLARWMRHTHTHIKKQWHWVSSDRICYGKVVRENRGASHLLNNVTWKAHPNPLWHKFMYMFCMALGSTYAVQCAGLCVCVCVSVFILHVFFSLFLICVYESVNNAMKQKNETKLDNSLCTSISVRQ